MEEFGDCEIFGGPFGDKCLFDFGGKVGVVGDDAPVFGDKNFEAGGVDFGRQVDFHDDGLERCDDGAAFDQAIFVLLDSIKGHEAGENGGDDVGKIGDGVDVENGGCYEEGEGGNDGNGNE